LRWRRWHKQEVLCWWIINARVIFTIIVIVIIGDKVVVRVVV
jgi:hypothetical protein